MPSRRPTNAELAERADLHERGLKRCDHCREVKPEADYHRLKAGSFGLNPRCKPCRKAQQAESWQRRKRGETRGPAQPHWRNRRVQQDASRRKNYGIEPAEYDALVLASEGRCDLCGEVMPDPCLDHDHADGRIRGLLHDECNRGLACFRDDPEKLRAAIAYLDCTHA